MEKPNGTCPTCELQECLPDQPHGPGRFYHVGIGRFVTLEEVDTNGGNGRPLEPRLPKGYRSLKTYERGQEERNEERKRKTRERVRRHRKRKRLEGARV